MRQKKRPRTVSSFFAETNQNATSWFGTRHSSTIRSNTVLLLVIHEYFIQCSYYQEDGDEMMACPRTADVGVRTHLCKTFILAFHNCCSTAGYYSLDYSRF